MGKVFTFRGQALWYEVSTAVNGQEYRQEIRPYVGSDGSMSLCSGNARLDLKPHVYSAADDSYMLYLAYTRPVSTEEFRHHYGFLPNERAEYRHQFRHDLEIMREVFQRFQPMPRAIAHVIRVSARLPIVSKSDMPWVSISNSELPRRLQLGNAGVPVVLIGEFLSEVHLVDCTHRIGWSASFLSLLCRILMVFNLSSVRKY